MVDTRQLGKDRLIWANIFPWLLPEINCLSSSLLLAAIKGHLGSRISRTMFWQRRSQNLGSGFQSDYQKWLSLFSGTVVVHLLLEKHYGTWVIVVETQSHVHLNELTASYSTPAPLQPLSEASVLEQPPPFCTPPPKKKVHFFFEANEQTEVSRLWKKQYRRTGAFCTSPSDFLQVLEAINIHLDTQAIKIV